MKLNTIVCFFVVFALAGTAVAGPVQVGTIDVTRLAGYFSGPGGEFTISDTTLSIGGYTSATSGIGTPANSFQTFCVELDEDIMPPYLDITTEMDTEAIQGGLAGGTPDPLDFRTAYLYTEFATGNLSNYDYTPSISGGNRDTDAYSLQQAIYFIEEEIGLTGDPLSQTATPAATLDSKALAWYNEAVGAGWTDTGNVYVLNPYHSSVRDDYQSMLYLVPVPGAVLLGFLGLSVAGIKLRKMV